MKVYPVKDADFSHCKVSNFAVFPLYFKNRLFPENGAIMVYDTQIFVDILSDFWAKLEYMLLLCFKCL